MSWVRDGLIVLDTETGGFDPDCDAILEVALVGVTTGASMCVDVADLHGYLAPEALRINGFTRERVRNGLTPQEATVAIERFLEQEKAETGHAPGIVCHNTAFDSAFLRRLYRLADEPIPKCFTYRMKCTQTLLWALQAGDAVPAEVSSLANACEYFKIEDQLMFHSALGDARRTVKLLDVLMRIL